MKLVIVESPAKSKTISKYLGSDYKVVASIGHVRDLPKSNKKAIDIEKGFVPHYEVSKGKEKVVEQIRELAKRADEIILATDPDREGEAIAWHLAEIIKKSSANSKSQITNPKIKRVTYHEITKEAVQDAFEHPRKIDLKLKEAQEARRVLDRLVGYDLSGLIWKKVRYGLSAGRVQSPALRIIMEREREIRAFRPEDFWVIRANLIPHPLTPSPTPGEGGKEITFACSEEPREESDAKKIVEAGRTGKWFVADILETEISRAPYAPFITSTLQQAASTRLGFAPARTMSVAQKLYEAGHITYMRTDSTNLAGSAISQIKKIVDEKYGADYFEARQFKSKSKNAQEAHEAIRPTVFTKVSGGINDDQKKLYGLIWSRAVASQMKAARLVRTRVVANIGVSSGTINTIPDFISNGQRVLSEGWFRADPAARSQDTNLPQLSKGAPLDLVDILSEQKQTEPPPRFSEAGLIKELEKRGIGRPSTYASIIKTIIDRNYVEKDGRALKPTDTGDVVSTFLEKNFGEYIDDTFTAKMEDELDDIANGKREYEPTLREFYKPFSKAVKDKEKLEKITTIEEADSSVKCPVCGSTMVVKLGRGGKFLSCEKFPDCKGMRQANGEPIEEPKPIGSDPESGVPIFVLDGRYGPFVQLGVGQKSKVKSQKLKVKRASIPKEKDPKTVIVEDALKYLSLPRVLGKHPQTGEEITANVGRFGPYIVHEKDFRSLKTDDVYNITLERAIEIFKEPKKTGQRSTKK